MGGCFRHQTAVVGDDLLNGERQALDIFDNALTGGVIGPREAQGVREVNGRAGTVPPVLACGSSDGPILQLEVDACDSGPLSL